MKKQYYSPTLEEQEITTSCGIMSTTPTQETLPPVGTNTPTPMPTAPKMP